MVTQRTVRQVRRVMLYTLAGLLLVMTLGVGSSAWRVYGTMREVHAERKATEAERDSLRARTHELQASVAELSTERGVESEIRTRYPLAKPGEVEFVFVDKAQKSSVDTATSTRESVWSSVRKWIGL